MNFAKCRGEQCRGESSACLSQESSFSLDAFGETGTYRPAGGTCVNTLRNFSFDGIEDLPHYPLPHSCRNWGWGRQSLISFRLPAFWKFPLQSLVAARPSRCLLGSRCS